MASNSSTTPTIVYCPNQNFSKNDIKSLTHEFQFVPNFDARKAALAGCNKISCTKQPPTFDLQQNSRSVIKPSKCCKKLKDYANFNQNGKQRLYLQYTRKIDVRWQIDSKVLDKCIYAPLYNHFQRCLNIRLLTWFCQRQMTRNKYVDIQPRNSPGTRSKPGTGTDSFLL